MLTTRAAIEIPAGHGLGALLHSTAERFGDQDALVLGEERLSYRDLDSSADRAAAAFVAAGAGPVAVVPVLDPRFAVAYFGAQRAGRTVVALSPFLTGDRLVRQLSAVGAGVAVLTAQLSDLLRPHHHELPGLRVVLISGADPAVETFSGFLESTPGRGPAAGVVDPAAAAYVHFTSGTTGTPKGVVMSHANLVANAAQTADAHELDTFRTVLNHLPIFHFMHLGAAVHAGATQILAPGVDTAGAFELAEHAGAQVFYALPAQLNRLAADPRLRDLRARSVQVVRTGGTALRPDVADALSAQLGVPVLQGYGMAETSALTHSGVRSRPVPESVGPPVAGTRCRIVDLGSGAVLPPGERGEVQVRGPQITVGYWQGSHPSPVRDDGWLATGDLGHQDEDGLLYLLDRLDDLFKTGNHLVTPADVESAFRAHGGVRDCAVVPYPDDIAGSVPALVVVLADGGDDRAAAQIAVQVNDGLGEPLRVRRVAAVAEIPGSAFGKVRRREIGRRLAERPQAPYPVPSSRSEERT